MHATHSDGGKHSDERELRATSARPVGSLRCGDVDRAPLPPHERPWRHPSELGPPEHEPTTTAGRVLIVATATLSLALIGLLVLTVTPDRSPDPSSAGATTRSATVTFAALERPSLPMVTPIGDDGWAVTTTGAVAGRSGILSARLPSGDIVDVEIVTTDKDSGLTVVSLPAPESGYDLAKGSLAPSDTVLVNGQPPRVVAMDELAALDVDEGTPVLDSDGHLVGLCTSSDHGTALRTVATMPPTNAPAAPTSAPTTAAPATTSPPVTTTIPPTTAPTTSSTTTSTVTPTTTGPRRPRSAAAAAPTAHQTDGDAGRHQ